MHIFYYLFATNIHLTHWIINQKINTRVTNNLISYWNSSRKWKQNFKAETMILTIWPTPVHQNINNKNTYLKLDLKILIKLNSGKDFYV